MPSASPRSPKSLPPRPSASVRCRRRCSRSCARRGSCAPARPRRSVRSKRRPRRRCSPPRRSREATRQPAGACRSQPPAACSPPICPRRAPPRSSATRSRSPPACGLRAAGPRPSTAALQGLRPLVVLQRHLPLAVAVRRLRARRPRRRRCRSRAARRRRCPPPSSRSSTRGTPAACAAPAATTPSRDDLFVPDDHVLSLMGAAPRIDTPLYRFPVFGFFALSIAAAALGNARGAIDDLGELAAGKTAQGSSRVLAERPATQAAVGEAEAALRAARALYYEAIEEAWEAAQQDGPVDVPLRLGLRLAATHAVRTAADVARSMYDLGGGTAIYEDSPLQRRFRDAHTATAHFQVNPAIWELTGQGAARPAGADRAAVSAARIAPAQRPAGRRAVLAGPARRGGPRDRLRGADATASTRCGSARWRRSTPSRSRPPSACARPASRSRSGRSPSACAAPSRWRSGVASVATLTGCARRSRARRLQPRHRQRLARPPVGRARPPRTRDGRGGARDPRRRARGVLRRARAHTRVSPQSTPARRHDLARRVRPEHDARGRRLRRSRSCSTSSPPSASHRCARSSTPRRAPAADRPRRSPSG